jgi:hypothetical protein
MTIEQRKQLKEGQRVVCVAADGETIYKDGTVYLNGPSCGLMIWWDGETSPVRENGYNVILVSA